MLSKFFWSNKGFHLSNIVLPLNLVLRVSFTFLVSKKWQNYCDEACSCFEWYMRHLTKVMVVYLFKVPFEFVIIIFLLYNKQKLLGMHIFIKINLITKKHPVKVTSTIFLFREVEQLAVYQLLPNLAIWEDFGWLSSGGELVSIWGTL